MAGLLLLAAGCSPSERTEKYGAATTGIFAPQPPAFLTGPASLLLVQPGGFHAHAAWTADPLSAHNAPLSGELIGKGTKLYFAPDPKKSAHGAGLSFIWDVGEGMGYALSDALQGFAPISSTAHPTNLSVATEQETAVKLDSHECRRQEVKVEMSDGSASQAEAWRAADLKGLPCRIVSGTNSGQFSLDLSKVRLEPPNDALFAPPDGFTKFDSSESMMREIADRQRALRAKGTEDLFVPPASSAAPYRPSGRP